MTQDSISLPLGQCRQRRVPTAVGRLRLCPPDSQGPWPRGMDKQTPSRTDNHCGWGTRAARPQLHTAHSSLHFNQNRMLAEFYLTSKKINLKNNDHSTEQENYKQCYPHCSPSTTPGLLTGWARLSKQILPLCSTGMGHLQATSAIHCDDCVHSDPAMGWMFVSPNSHIES